jgi:hypothetical protein
MTFLDSYSLPRKKFVDLVVEFLSRKEFVDLVVAFPFRKEFVDLAITFPSQEKMLFPFSSVEM